MTAEIELSALSMWLEEIKEVSALLWEKGWAERNAGNLSIDVTSALEKGPSLGAARGKTCSTGKSDGYASLTGTSLLVTGSGCRFRDIACDPVSGACIIRISADGRSYEMIGLGGTDVPFRPTSELPTHLLIHDFLRRTGSNKKVVLHTHPTELIALTQMAEFQDQRELNRALWGMMPEVKVVVPRGAGLVPYLMPGSEDLATSTVAMLEKGHEAVLWARHGCLAVGESAVETFDTIDTLNKGAQVLLHCLAAGRTPVGISDSDLEDLVRKFNLKC